jgi:hypothetical protein
VTTISPVWTDNDAKRARRPSIDAVCWHRPQSRLSPVYPRKAILRMDLPNCSPHLHLPTIRSPIATTESQIETLLLMATHENHTDGSAYLAQRELWFKQYGLSSAHVGCLGPISPDLGTSGSLCKTASNKAPPDYHPTRRTTRQIHTMSTRWQHPRGRSVLVRPDLLRRV